MCIVTTIGVTGYLFAYTGEYHGSWLRSDHLQPPWMSLDNDGKQKPKWSCVM